MANHSSILVCKISWTEEPGGLQSKGLQRVGHDWATEHTGTQVVYSVVLVSGIQQGESVVHMHISTLFGFFSCISHYRVLSRVPCVIYVCMLSSFCHLWLFATLRAVAHQSHLSMGFSRQEYWSGLPCPPPGDLPDQGSNQHLLSLLPWQVGSLPLVLPGKVVIVNIKLLFCMVGSWIFTTL